MYTKISSVESLCFSILKSNPPQLVVHSTGIVPTGGWSNGRLIPYVYVTPPADGVQDFDFAAQAPSGQVIQVESPITASWTGSFPIWMKGARIHSSTNNIEEQIADAACLHKARDLGDADDLPWPINLGNEIPWPY